MTAQQTRPKTKQKIRIGIIGLQPGRSWAARAHIPALRALPDDFEIVGVANSSRASAEAAAKDAKLPRAFDNVDQLVASADIDVVAVTVKVPHHLTIVKAAIAAGKHVYCEWPLGNGLAEAEELARLARERGIVAVAGTQACVAPGLEFLRDLIAGGFVGEVLSSAMIASSAGYGAETTAQQLYLFDRTTGANMLTIPVGHTLAGLREVLGPFVEVEAMLASRRKTVKVVETAEIRPVTTPDSVLLNGRLAGGAVASLHFRGGVPKGLGLYWQIDGTEGDIVVTGNTGHLQYADLSISGASTKETELRPLVPPRSLVDDWPETGTVGNVARMYARMARDIRAGTSTAPTFADAVSLHRLIDAIERSAAAGERVRL